ncbi:MAG: hypothetical protein KI792_08535 [Alphaproteobacteria bacterium]|nr:hypothetical protein [Alphaproteobacteria bacterium SS10]
MTAYARELQIQIDDVYSCPGNCAGCVLSADERRTRNPDMSTRVLDLTYERLDRYIPQLDNLSYINLTYGIGDHMRMPLEYLKNLHERGADLLERHGYDGPKNAVFFSTSLIGKAKNLMPDLEALADHDRRVKFLPIAILDPALLYNKNFGEVYEGNISRTKALFGQVDLAINLSEEAITRITPRELHDFAVMNDFDEVTVNWVPTRMNIAQTAQCIETLADWLIEFESIATKHDRISSSFAPVLTRSINAVMCKSADGVEPPSLKQTIEEILPETVRKSIQFDHFGNLLPKLEAVGDVSHGSRFDLPALGNIREGEIDEMLDQAMPGLKSRIMGIHSRSKACMQCPNLSVCAATGFHVPTHILGDTGRDSSECPHVAAQLIDHFKQRAIITDQMPDGFDGDALAVASQATNDAGREAVTAH